MNTCNFTIRDVELALTPSGNVVFLNETIIRIGDVQAGISKDIYLSIYVPSSSGNSASLSISATYINEESGMYETLKQVKSFLLRGLIEITLTDVAVIPERPSPGQPFSITLTVTNIGTSTAYALYALPVTEGLPVKTYGTKSVYIGNLEINTPVSFTITLILTEKAKVTLLKGISGSLRIPIMLIYMDNLRTLHNKTIIIPISISNQTVTTTPSSGSKGIIIEYQHLAIITAVIMIAAIIFTILIRRRVRK